MAENLSADLEIPDDHPMAREFRRVLKESEANRERLDAGIGELNEVFLQVAAGNFSVGAPRTGTGDPLDVLGFLLDSLIAELKETFEEVERQRWTLQGTFDSMADALIVVGPGGRIEATNGTTSRILGWPSQDLERMSIDQLLGPREKELARLLAEGQEAQPFRARATDFVDQRGAKLQLSVSGSPITSGSDIEGRFVLVARDERELRAAREQLQLADRMATMGTLAAGVAHEINNPLSYVISNIEYVLEELDELEDGAPLAPALRSELQRALTSSKTGSERIADIVRDLKSISRVDNESAVSVDLQRVADSATAMLKNEIRHRARLRKEYDEVPGVFANEARILQVVLNLLQNAAQSIPVGHVDDNEIVIGTFTAENGEAVLSIADTGSGIPEEDLVEVFEAFYTTKPVGEGTGLGLSISQRLVTQLGGRIEVDSTVGRGTTFRVFFPAADDANSVPAHVPTPAPTQSTRRQRVLVVDDEVEIGESVRRILGDEHDVDLATTGTDALTLFENGDYDVVLIDWKMPEMSGRELREILSARFPGHSALLVVMSGGSVSLKFKMTDVVLEKPFSPAKLRNLIERVASEKP